MLPAFPSGSEEPGWEHLLQPLNSELREKRGSFDPLSAAGLRIGIGMEIGTGVGQGDPSRIPQGQKLWSTQGCPPCPSLPRCSSWRKHPGRKGGKVARQRRSRLPGNGNPGREPWKDPEPWVLFSHPAPHSILHP